MRYKKSKAIYMLVLFILFGAALLDNLNPRQKAIEIAISSSSKSDKATIKFAALVNLKTKSKIYNNEKDLNTTSHTCD